MVKIVLFKIRLEFVQVVSILDVTGIWHQVRGQQMIKLSELHLSFGKDALISGKYL